MESHGSSARLYSATSCLSPRSSPGSWRSEGSLMGGSVGWSRAAKLPCWWLLLCITWIRRQLNEEHNKLGMMQVACNEAIMLPLAMSKGDGSGKPCWGQTRAQAHGWLCPKMKLAHQQIIISGLLKPVSQKWTNKLFKRWLFDILFLCKLMKDCTDYFRCGKSHT